MAHELQGKRIAVPAADGVERVEPEQPRQALHEAGARTELLSLHDGVTQARDDDLEAAGTFDVDARVRSASVDDDAPLLRGGTVDPDEVRVDQAAVGAGGRS